MKTHLRGKKLSRMLLLYFICIFCSTKLLATNVSGNQSGTWTKANSPYVISGTVTVPAGKKLIIEAGVEVRSLRYDDRFEVDGVLYAVGTAVDSIHFNGFANAAVDPTSTHGGLMLINSTSSDSTVLAYVAMNKWGDKDYYTGDQAAIELQNGVFIMRNSTLSNSELQGIWGYGDLTKTPVITNCVFVNNPQTIRLFTDNVGAISNCTNAVIYLQGGTFSRASTISKPGTNSYYVLDKASSHYFENAKLTIQAGVEIHSTSYADRIQLDGTSVLVAKGTSSDSIKFKGYADLATDPTSTHGGLMLINSSGTTDSTVMTYISMDKWGDKDYYTGDQTAIELESGNFVMHNSLISNAEYRGIWAYGDLAKDPVIDKVTFTNTPISVAVYSDNAGAITGCTGAKITLQGGTFSKPSTISKPGSGSYYILDKGSSHYFENVKLTIQAGVEIRSMNYADRIQIDGTSVLVAKGTSSDSIKFKGFADPATDPTSTHGGFLLINSSGTSDSTVMTYVSMDKWGDKDYYTGDQTAIELESGNFVIRNSVISNAEFRGIWGYGDLTKDPVIAGVTFINDSIPVSLYTDNAGSISGCTNAYITLQGGTFSKTSTISKPGTNSYYLLDKGSSHYFENVPLIIQPGVEIRSRNYADRIQIDGKSVLKAIGNETDSIWFKGFADPSSNAKSTHGGLILINSSGTADSTVFAYAVVDKMGDKDYYTGDQAAIELENGNMRITNSTIRNSELKGIFGYGDASHVTVYKSYLYNNPNAAVFNAGRPLFRYCNIYSNPTYAINNLSSATPDTVDARTCWWGDSTGPKQSTLNPNGKGNPVSKKVLFNPWLLKPYQVNDIGVKAIVAPVSSCSLSNAEQVKVKITNYGSKTQKGFNISYRINNGPVVTENVGTLSVASDSVVQYTFATNADFSTPGATYTLKVFTALTGDTIPANDTVTAIVINKKPNLGKDTTINICAGSIAKLSSLYNTTGYTSVNWSTTKPDSATAGTYSLVVVNTAGCADTATITVANSAKPNLGKDTTVKVCPGAYLSIKKLYDTTGLATAWSTARPDSVVKGTYTLVVTNVNGCKDTAVITVGNLTKPNLGKDTTVKICTGTFTNITHLYDTTGYKQIKYSVTRPDSVGKGSYKLIVTNSSGCMDTAVIKVDTLPLPAKPSLTKNGNTTFCLGDSLVLSTTSTGTLQWFRNNTAIKKASTTKYVVKLGGSYKLQVSNAGSCAVFSDSLVASVPQIPKPTITLLSDSLISSSTTGNQWFESDVTITGATGQKYSPDFIDAYTVQVTSSGCKSPMSDPFYYTANTLMKRKNAGTADMNGAKKGVTEMKVDVYPNPVINEANVLVSGMGDKIAITVTDVTGRRVLTATSLYNSKVTLQMQNLASGMYMITVTDGKQTKTMRLLKQ